MFDQLRGTTAAMRRLIIASLLGGLLIVASTAAAQPRAAKVDTLAQIEGGSGGLSIDQQGNLYSAEFGDSLGGTGAGTRVFRITPGRQSGSLCRRSRIALDR